MGDNRQPQNISVLLEQGARHHQLGEFKLAEDCYRKVLQMAPSDPVTMHLLGVLSFQTNRYEEAVSWIEKAVATGTEQSFRFLTDLGNIHKDKGNLAAAARCFLEAIDARPDFPDALVGLGEIHELNNRLEDAVACYQDSLEVDSTHAVQIHMKLGILHGKLSQLSRAVENFKEALELEPGLAPAYFNLGYAYQRQGASDLAIQAYRSTLKFDPNYINAHINLGALLHNQGDYDEADEYYRQALELEADNPRVLNNLGLLRKHQGRPEESAAWFEKAIEEDPDNGEYIGNYTYHLKDICDWKNLLVMSEKLDACNQLALATGTKTPEAPFSNLTRHADPALNLAVARSWSDQIESQIPKKFKGFSFDSSSRDKRITVGYLSNNFGNHPVAHQMQDLYGLHDRERFVIHCYSYGRDDGSEFRAKISGNCDKFVDISRVSDHEAAQLIHADRVNILIDLVGHTENNRMSICAYRPAPIQAGYLGYPGTSGSSFIDYLICDEVVTPPGDAPFYTEKFVYMPDTYQINELTVLEPDSDIKKSDYDLPENCLIFCSFNRPFKIDPDIFDTWMEILREVNGSVLWLLAGGNTAENNLRDAVARRGIDPQRLIFAGAIPLRQHMARVSLADIALDTSIYNGGATTSHVMRVGMPLITLRGKHFLSRMSASALTAAGSPELIASDLDEYKEIAIRLCRNPSELEQVRKKIAENIQANDVFGTVRFVRHLEMRYEQMWSIYKSGENPRPIHSA